MKKLFSILSLLAFVSVFTVGCGGGAAKTTTPAKTTSPATTSPATTPAKTTTPTS